MTRYLSSKNTITILILWSLVLSLLIILYLNFKIEHLKALPLIIVMVVIVVIIWILLDTRYVIKSNFLLYRSGPFRGRIDVMKITKIKHHSGYNLPVTMKPALNYKGFIISFNTNDEVFVSPKHHVLFIDELLKINQKIEIILQ